MGTLSIPLTQGKSALIDDEDAALITGHRWYAAYHPSPCGGRWYALARIDGRNVYMHRLLMGHPELWVDHKNGDGLDNRRSANLRLATPAQNSVNRSHEPRGNSGYRGVIFDRGKWRVVVQVNGKRYQKRTAVTAEEAARQYDEMARELLGDFAVLNFPEQEVSR